MGTYYVKEEFASDGYTKNPEIYEYTFSYKDSLTKTIEVEGTIGNVVMKAPFSVIKISSNTNNTASTVAGAEFTAILSRYVDYYRKFRGS